MEEIREDLPWMICGHLQNLRALIEGAIGSTEIASESDKADRAYCALILLREAYRELNLLIKTLNAESNLKEDTNHD